MAAPTAIVGAGLAGLIAAHAWPSTKLFERSPRPADNHRALLRFRTDAVARLTGVEFRKILVRKGIWANGGFCQPNIALANAYSQKTLGLTLGDRSIWNVEPVERFVAPETFYAELVGAVRSRIEWNASVDLAGIKGQWVTTAPLPETLSMLMPGAAEGINFVRSPIHVSRGTVMGADVHQTVYFPAEHDGPLYRASITGDQLIMEFAGDAAPTDDLHKLSLENVGDAFQLDMFGGVELTTITSQRYGKIAPINEIRRKQFLFDLSHIHNLYSLGRFATWRNILLDDVVKDIDVLKRLMKGGVYDSTLSIF